MTSIAAAPVTAPSGSSREARLVTVLIVAFLAWIPLQTPVAVLAYQYLHVSVTVAQAILLVEGCLGRGPVCRTVHSTFPGIRFNWFDWFALAFGILVVVYSVVPALLGSHLPAVSVVSSARELLVPVELYGLGRLAAYAGVSPVAVVKGFLVVAAAAAVFSVATWYVMPQTFWATTYNLVGFVHDVQGVTTATDLWWASIVNTYIGYGDALRAVGPFTHPVGTGVYFAMPLTLALCAVWMSNLHRRTAFVITGAALVLFALAVITPISRGTWIGFLGAAVVGGAVLHKYRLAVATVVLFAVFVAVRPPVQLRHSDSRQRNRHISRRPYRSYYQGRGRCHNDSGRERCRSGRSIWAGLLRRLRGRGGREHVFERLRQRGAAGLLCIRDLAGSDLVRAPLAAPTYDPGLDLRRCGSRTASRSRSRNDGIHADEVHHRGQHLPGRGIGGISTRFGISQARRCGVAPPQTMARVATRRGYRGEYVGFVISGSAPGLARTPQPSAPVSTRWLCPDPRS